MDRNVTDHKIDTTINSFELYVGDNSDDDLQPVVTARKRKSKGKATDSEFTTTSSTGISTTDEPPMVNKITLDDYDLEYSSDDFDAPVVKRPFWVNQPSLLFVLPNQLLLLKPIPTAFKSAAGSVKSSFCPVPVDKASDIKEGPKKISKRPLYDLVHTTNLLVTHTFTFTKQLISKYKEAYFKDSGYTSPQLTICSANNPVRVLRGLINKLFKKKEKAEGLRGEMKTNKSSSKAIKEVTRKKIYRHCNQVKLVITKKEMPEIGLLYDQSRTQLNVFLSSYLKDYTFQENSIYYDVMASPENHFKAFFRLAELSEAEQTKQFACFPLCTTFVPCCMTLDSKIIHYHVLKSKKNPKTGSKFETWGAVVDLNKRRSSIKDFKSLCGSKELSKQMEKSPKPNTEKKVDGNQTEHIEGLGQADLKSTEGKCVLVDPGRRDLMYCMKETSTVEEKQLLIFIKNNRSKCSRHFRYLRKRTQPFVVQKVETILSRSESNSVDLKKFVQNIFP
ncbi:hypothetical protein G6F61_004929 [Rhizopus arrhizus]|nr:hypothetical protein G6F61_004929 [Rhizopus arrhizus]